MRSLPKLPKQQVQGNYLSLNCNTINWLEDRHNLLLRLFLIYASAPRDQSKKTVRKMSFFPKILLFAPSTAPSVAGGPWGPKA
jgi:hypothetical protein